MMLCVFAFIRVRRETLLISFCIMHISFLMTLADLSALRIMLFSPKSFKDPCLTNTFFVV